MPAGSRIGHIAWRVIRRSMQDNVLIFAGYASFASLLSLFPFIIFLMAVAGLISRPDAFKTVIDYALSYLPANVVNVITPVIRDILGKQSPGLMTLGGLGTLWAASSGVEGLRFGLNDVYEADEVRPFWKRRLQSLAIVLGSAIALFLLALAVIAWPLLIGFIRDHFSIAAGKGAVLNAVRFLLAALLLMGLFCALYRFLPNHRLRWRALWPGGLLATALWLALAQLFSVYLTHFNHYDATYGSIGGVIITLLFFYYSAAVFLVGAEFNCVLASSSIPAPPAMP